MPRDLTPDRPPRWAVALGSLAIGFHLFNALLTTLHVSSGPWVTPLAPGGVSLAEPPPFTYWVGENVTTPYNRVVKVNNSFHFESNKQEVQEITFEAVVKDAAGKVVARHKVPDPEANAFVRQRQGLLARHLIDMTVPPPQAVVLPPVGQELPTLYWWQQEGERSFKLRRGTANDVPRNQPMIDEPTDTALIAARAYGRHLRRQHDAAAVELTRLWRHPIMPSILFAPTPPTQDILKPNVSSYGELPQ